MTTAADVEVLRSEYRTVRREFERLVRAIDARGMTRPLTPGGWSPREVVIHIAAWLAEACERVPAIMAGSPPRAYDPDTFNAAAIAAAEGWTPEQAFGAYYRAADRFDAIAGDVTDDDLAEEPDVRAWLESAARVMISEHLVELGAAEVSRQ